MSRGWSLVTMIAVQLLFAVLSPSVVDCGRIQQQDEGELMMDNHNHFVVNQSINQSGIFTVA